MQLGDQVLFYHSVIKPGVIGLAKVVQEAYPDPTVANDPAQAKFGWVVVDLEPIMILDKPVPLALIKSEPLLANISLIRQSRLSVMPLRPDEFELILKMGQKENYE